MDGNDHAKVRCFLYFIWVFVVGVVLLWGMLLACVLGTHRGCCCALLLFRDIAPDHGSFMKVLQTDTHIFAELFNEFKPKSTRKVKKSKMRFKQYVDTVYFIFLAYGWCRSSCPLGGWLFLFVLLQMFFGMPAMIIHPIFVLVVCVWVLFFFLWWMCIHGVVFLSLDRLENVQAFFMACRGMLDMQVSDAFASLVLGTHTSNPTLLWFVVLSTIRMECCFRPMICWMAKI